MSNSKKIVIGVIKKGGRAEVWQSESLDAFMDAHRADINVVYSKELGYAPYDASTGVADWDRRYTVEYAERFDPKVHAANVGKNAKEYTLSPLAQAYVDTLGLSPIEAIRKERKDLEKAAKKNS